ncbi:MAG: NAD(P)/FAD-dependent oxidoreductase [Defluviitaleaceae bacterium]|nr:NAD(P)/FAD-dependent oxidoreductase [Defluviitaleaceae bacterium]
MMAAGAAAEHSAQDTRVVLLEKNESLGKKLLLTGGSRCNITNTADVADFVEKVLRNPHFLYSALYGFDSSALRDFLHELGLATKVEDEGRVFPVSDDAVDVLKAFVGYLKNAGVEVLLNAPVADISSKSEQGFLVRLEDGREIVANAVVIATGGLSAPHTGSTGDGYKITKNLGHNITKLYPAIVPLTTQKPDITELMGLSMTNVELVAKRDGKVTYKDLGDIIFTHFGISGPLALRASAHLAKSLHMPHEFYLDFMPNFSEKDLDDSILKIFAQSLNKSVQNCLLELLPSRLVSTLLESAGVGEGVKANELTKDARKSICRYIKAFKLEVTGSVGFGAAVITCGGVECNEIDPSTMQSKLVPNLYFAGEVMDVDALTGGYNLTIAFSTGRLAGKSAALS